MSSEKHPRRHRSAAALKVLGSEVAPLRGVPSRRRALRDPAGKSYQLKLTLVNASAPVWRRIRVQGSVSVRVLNQIVHKAFGWYVRNTYRLTVHRPWHSAGTYVGGRRGVCLSDLVSSDDALSFTHDYGRGGEVFARVEEVRPALKRCRPVCLGGGGAWPERGAGLEAEPLEERERLGRIDGEGGEPLDVDAVTAALQRPAKHPFAEETIAEEERCGVCGRRTSNLRHTSCCRRLVCADRGCSRHDRFTVCGVHHAEGHAGGDWRDCGRCRRYFAEVEMYVFFATNRYNFEVLENPPAYPHTHCGRCGRLIRLSREAHSVRPDGSYRCGDCWEDD